MRKFSSIFLRESVTQFTETKASTTEAIVESSSHFYSAQPSYREKDKSSAHSVTVDSDTHKKINSLKDGEHTPAKFTHNVTHSEKETSADSGIHSSESNSQEHSGTVVKHGGKLHFFNKNDQPIAHTSSLHESLQEAVEASFKLQEESSKSE